MNKFFKSNFILFLFIIIFGVIFFSYNITLTWDSSEYIGMAKSIGSIHMKENWIRASWIFISITFENFYAIQYSK